MGLQSWPPSTPALSTMACLDVETPSICRGKFKSVLQLCLQQRRTREQLAEQGIMPPLKAPATFHERIRSLERARTGSFLKHKLCSRPERSELVRLHILQETQAEPSLQATQMKLKRARLADNLNEKITQRPGPLELVEKNILPVDSAAEEGPNDDKAACLKPADVYSFNEDSSEALSPQQPAHPPFASSDAGENDATCASSKISPSTQRSPSPLSQSASDAISLVRTAEHPSARKAPAPHLITTVTSCGSVRAKQSLSRLPTDKSRSKRNKEPKPRVKKLKYHQYIPPDRKQEPSEVQMDSAYARLLQQQQQFLQLQILSQQQFNFQASPSVNIKYGCFTNTYTPVATRIDTQGSRLIQLLFVREDSGSPPVVCDRSCTMKNWLVVPTSCLSCTPSLFLCCYNRPTAEAQSSCSSIVLAGTAAPSHVQPQQSQVNGKPDHLPANLDEMKVAELKMELKLRSLPVSGTKTDLIERLRLYQETSNLQTAAASVEKTVIAEAPQPENVKLSPPVSPIASRVSSLGIEDRGAVDGPAQLAVTAASAHSVGSAVEESPTDKRSPEKDSEKDKRLHEKERQIKELMRKLEQEQRLVEELKMQLEVEKRSQHSDSPPHFSPLQVKEENMSPSSCSGACSSPGLIKQEHVEDPVTQVLQSHFVMGHQTAKPPEPEQPAEAGAHILLAAPFPATTIAIQLPTSSIILHSPDNSAALGLLPPAVQMPPNAEASQQQCGGHPKAWRVDSTTPTFLNTFPVGGRPAGASSGQADRKDPANVSPRSSQPAFVQPPKFPNRASKSKDPPCYEDAVKQTRSLQSAVQGPTAASQHMDDLFDVLIESGEISPFVRQDATSQETPLPVTASVTTLPINTVLSRPPPQVQVAQLPAASLRARPGLADLSSPSLLGRTLACSDSPAVTMEMDFNDSTLPSSLNLNGAGMDNMDWLDLNLSAEGVSSLDISAPAGVFSDFLDSHDLQLNWD
ncbi:MKL/myocardin-like protein 2 [Takifugu flavidus]|uniref:MKL/myocardin-like protein 2 n=1 Tax=Takifugu flavidus TaxID=433684 RepID=A0A5C6NUD8_9TELE|nr:MKL/myocardin-like protein 2 [Takifugu flavidus]